MLPTDIGEQMPYVVRMAASIMSQERVCKIRPARRKSARIEGEPRTGYLDKAYDELKRQNAELTQLHRDLEEEVKQRREAEDSLCASLKAWQDTFDAAQDAICVLSRDHRILLCNRAMAEACRDIRSSRSSAGIATK